LKPQGRGRQHGRGLLASASAVWGRRGLGSWARRVDREYSDQLSAFLLELRHGLKRATWIEIDPSNIGAIHQERAVGGGAPFVKIHVDAIRDFKLLEAANSLASALNEEGIAATVLESEIGIASENTIHILVEPKQGESSV
jgi:hypothetical protein